MKLDFLDENLFSLSSNLVGSHIVEVYLELGVKQFLLVHVLDVFQIHPTAGADLVLMVMIFCEVLLFAVLYAFN